MYRITFEYRDRYTNGEWKKQVCEVSSLDRCIDIYELDLDNDCEYSIVDIVNLDLGV